MVNPSIWKGRRVLVTGHTGFKGSWLALWLHSLGARVTGFALPPPTSPSLFDLAAIEDVVDHIEGDIRDLAAIEAAVTKSQPEVIFHLAAQPLVRLSYEMPVETYATNVMGSVHVMEAARRVGGVQAMICVTTDKCYENKEWIWPYRESDPMGGYDPYSSSKGAAELAIAAYRSSYFPPANMKDGGCGLASVRAGNVIGGGDWADDRLVPDLVRAFSAGRAPEIRSPHAVRPWQHVLEALGGYLMIAERLIAREPAFAEAWNFGPSDDDAQPVSWIVEHMHAAWGGNAHQAVHATATGVHEAGLLRLDSSKVRAALGWRPALTLQLALEWIVDWHQRVESGDQARVVTMSQINHYTARLTNPRGT